MLVQEGTHSWDVGWHASPGLWQSASTPHCTQRSSTESQRDRPSCMHCGSETHATHCPDVPSQCRVARMQSVSSVHPPIDASACASPSEASTASNDHSLVPHAPRTKAAIATAAECLTAFRKRWPPLRRARSPLDTERGTAARGPSRGSEPSFATDASARQRRPRREGTPDTSREVD